MKAVYRFCSKCNKFHRSHGVWVKRHARFMTPYYTQNLRDKEGRLAVLEILYLSRETY